MLGLWFQLSLFTVNHDKDENGFSHNVCKGEEIILKITHVAQVCLKELVCCLFGLEGFKLVAP